LSITGTKRRLAKVKKPPPPPNGSNGSNRSSSGDSGSGVIKRSGGPGRTQQGPPLAPIATCAAILVSQFVGLSANRSHTYLHLFLSLIGMFGSVVALGWFRHGLNNNRSSGRFGDWGGPIQSTGLIWVLVILSWISGVIKMFFSVY
jgi:hypothetical protein